MEDSKVQKLIIINLKLLQILEDGLIIIFQNGQQILIIDKIKSHLSHVLLTSDQQYYFLNK
jgi:hypothetical protein